MAETHDMQAARGTYESFIGVLKWAVPTLAALALFIIVIIS